MDVRRKSGSCGSLAFGSPWDTFAQGPLRTWSAEGISTLAIFYSWKHKNTNLFTYLYMWEKYHLCKVRTNHRKASWCASVDKCHIFPEAVHAGSNLLSHPALLCAETEKQFILLCSLNAFKTSFTGETFLCTQLQYAEFNVVIWIAVKTDKQKFCSEILVISRY